MNKKQIGEKMKKIFILEDLDCANCASKIETEVGKLSGVNKCSVSLMAQKMVLEIADEIENEIEKEVKKIVKKYEPDVTVIAK